MIMKYYLKYVPCEKILGVFIDNNSTWVNHTDVAVKKIVYNLWLLSRIKIYLSTNQTIQFYISYIQPHIDYLMLSGVGYLRIYRLQKELVKSF